MMASRPASAYRPRGCRGPHQLNCGQNSRTYASVALVREEEPVVRIQAANDEEDDQGRHEQAPGVGELGKLRKHGEDGTPDP